MKNLNDLKTDLNAFLSKNRKLALFAPVGIILFLSLLFFTSQGQENDKTFDEVKKSNIDNSLPEASSKPLPENTLDVMSENDIYEQTVKKDENEASFEEGKYERPYQQPNDQVTEKLNSIITKYDKQTSTRVAPKKTTSSRYREEEIDEELNEEPIVSKKTIVEKQPVSKKQTSSSGFFKKSNKTKSFEDLNIYAAIHGNQTIMNTQRVKFRTTKEFTYEGQKYPINTIVYGTAEIRPNRLFIKIIKINQTDLKLDVYDSEDSLEGLYVLTPNLNASLQKELKKEGIEDDDLKSIPFSKSLKNIFEKKVREEKVTLINNYKIIIKITK